MPRIVLQQEYEGYASGKELEVTTNKLLELETLGVMFRLMGPRLKARVSDKRVYEFEHPTKPSGLSRQDTVTPKDEEE